MEPWVASDLLRQHRALFAAYTSAPPETVDLERQLPAAAAGLAAARRPVPPLNPEAIPVALRELVQEHEARAGVRVEPLRLVVTGTGDDMIVAGDQGLPDEGELVSFSVTRAPVRW